MCQFPFQQSSWPAHEQHLIVLVRKIQDKQRHQTPTKSTTILWPQFSASPKKFVMNFPNAPHTPEINIIFG